MQLFIQTPAKINLSLEIEGRRTDGYHTLKSLMAPVGLCDEITLSTDPPPPSDPLTAAARPEEALRFEDLWRCFEKTALPPSLMPLRNMSLSCRFEGPEADESLRHLPPSRNLLYRALVFFLSRSGDRQLKPYSTLHFTVYKRIPAGAGFGGGSGNAAGVLRLCGRIWGNVSFSNAEIAYRIGADVPFFMDARLCLMTGIGEILTPLKAVLPPRAVLLLRPKAAGLSTQRVFETWRNMEKSARSGGRGGGRKDKDTAFLPANRPNDLVGAAAHLCPEIREILNLLEEDPSIAVWGMSGTGTGCFALMAASAAQIPRRYENYWAKIVGWGAAGPVRASGGRVSEPQEGKKAHQSL